AINGLPVMRLLIGLHAMRIEHELHVCRRRDANARILERHGAHEGRDGRVGAGHQWVMHVSPPSKRNAVARADIWIDDHHALEIAVDRPVRDTRLELVTTFARSTGRRRPSAFNVVASTISSVSKCSLNGIACCAISRATAALLAQNS